MTKVIVTLVHVLVPVYSSTVLKHDFVFQQDALHEYWMILTFSDPTSDLVQQYDFPVPLRCPKTSDTVFVAFVRLLSEPVQRFSSCSTDFSQQIVQAVFFLFLYVFLF